MHKVHAMRVRICVTCVVSVSLLTGCVAPYVRPAIVAPTYKEPELPLPAWMEEQRVVGTVTLPRLICVTKSVNQKEQPVASHHSEPHVVTDVLVNIHRSMGKRMPRYYDRFGAIPKEDLSPGGSRAHLARRVHCTDEVRFVKERYERTSAFDEHPPKNSLEIQLINLQEEQTEQIASRSLPDIYLETYKREVEAILKPLLRKHLEVLANAIEHGITVIEAEQRIVETERRIAEEKREKAEEERRRAEAERIAQQKREAEIAKAKERREAEIQPWLEKLSGKFKTSDEVLRYQKQKNLQVQNSPEAEAVQRLYNLRVAEEKQRVEQERKKAANREIVAKARRVFGLTLDPDQLENVPEMSVFKLLLLGNPYTYERKLIILNDLIFKRTLSKDKAAFIGMGQYSEVIGLTDEIAKLQPLTVRYRLLVVFKGMDPYTTGAGGVVNVPTFYILKIMS